MIGDRLGTTCQAQTRLLPFVHRGSLRSGGRAPRSGGEREDVFVPSECVYISCVGMCVCTWSRGGGTQDSQGQGGPRSVPLSLLSPETNPVKPTRLGHKKTENKASKQRASLLSANGSKSSLHVVTADERIIKRRAVLTERSHTAQHHSVLFTACSAITATLISFTYSADV